MHSVKDEQIDILQKYCNYVVHMKLDIKSTVGRLAQFRFKIDSIVCDLALPCLLVMTRVLFHDDTRDLTVSFSMPIVFTASFKAEMRKATVEDLNKLTFQVVVSMNPLKAFTVIGCEVDDTATVKDVCGSEISSICITMSDDEKVINFDDISSCTDPKEVIAIVSARVAMLEKKFYNEYEADACSKATQKALDNLVSVKKMLKTLMEIDAENGPATDTTLGENVRIAVNFKKMGMAFFVECTPTTSIGETKLELLTSLLVDADPVLVAMTLQIEHKGEVIDDSLCWKDLNDNAHAIEVVMDARDPDEHLDIATLKQLSAGGGFGVLLCEKLRDGIELNEKFDGSKKLTIKVQTIDGNIKIYFYYNVRHTFKNVYAKLAVLIGQTAPEFRLKWASSSSILESWEPIDATLCDVPYCEMVIAMRGGAKPLTPLVKKSIVNVMQKHLKEERTKAMKKAIELTAETVVKKDEKIVCIEQAIGAFMEEIEKGAVIDAIKFKVANLDANSCIEILKVFDKPKGNPEYKMAKIAPFLFGKTMCEVYADWENYGKIVATCGHVGSYAWAKATASDDKINMGTLRTLVVKQQGHLEGVHSKSLGYTANESDAVDDITKGMADMKP